MDEDPDDDEAYREFLASHSESEEEEDENDGDSDGIDSNSAFHSVSSGEEFDWSGWSFQDIIEEEMIEDEIERFLDLSWEMQPIERHQAIEKFVSFSIAICLQ